MQPYLLPYIGYFQLINSVDQFVIFDDVNFIKKGWINRNRILVNGVERLFTLPISNASQNSLIKDLEIFNAQQNKKLLLKTILHSYKRAPFFDDVSKLFEEIIIYSERNLSKYIGNSLAKICHYLGINSRFVYSSELGCDQSYTGQKKIISIVKKLGGDSYFNLPGGIDLYDKTFFADHGVELNFIRPAKILYEQFNKANFVPNLSIVDVLMFNSLEKIKGQTILT